MSKKSVVGTTTWTRVITWQVVWELEPATTLTISNLLRTLSSSATNVTLIRSIKGSQNLKTTTVAMVASQVIVVSKCTPCQTSSSCEGIWNRLTRSRSSACSLRWPSRPPLSPVLYRSTRSRRRKMISRRLRWRRESKTTLTTSPTSPTSLGSSRPGWRSYSWKWSSSRSNRTLHGPFGIQKRSMRLSKLICRRQRSSAPLQTQRLAISTRWSRWSRVSIVSRSSSVRRP